MPPLLRPSLLPIFFILLSLLPIIVPIHSPEPQPSITSLMSKNGCKAFADLLHSSSDAADSYNSNIESGLTAFCPIDSSVKSFLPRFKNLTADEKISLLLYHAIPIYYSIQMLKSNNGVVNTLATDGTSKNYNFTVQNDGEVVTLQTKVGTEKIVDAIFDKDPVAVYSINGILEPMELFKPPEVPVPAPVPDEVADSPQPAGKKRKRGAPSPAADQNAAINNGAAIVGRTIAGAVASMSLVLTLILA